MYRLLIQFIIHFKGSNNNNIVQQQSPPQTIRNNSTQQQQNRQQSQSNRQPQQTRQPPQQSQATPQLSQSQLQTSSSSNTVPASESNTTTPKAPEKKFHTPTGPGSGFMASYLKFLQGERDTSPPPSNRGTGTRKTWSRSSANTYSATPPTSNVNANPNAQLKANSDTISNGNHSNVSLQQNTNTSCAYDRKRTSDELDNKQINNKQQACTNKSSNNIKKQNTVERAPQVSINMPNKKARTQSTATNNAVPSSLQTHESGQTGIGHQLAQQNPQSDQQIYQHAQLAAAAAPMYYQQPDSAEGAFSNLSHSYIDFHLRRQRW